MKKEVKTRIAIALTFLLGIGAGITIERYRLSAWLKFEASLENGEVTKVVDGDTIYVIADGREEKIRMLFINTPERDMQGYRGAKEALQKLIDGKKVSLELEEPGKSKRDKFGRLLASIVVDGKNVNIELVRQGWTPFYTRFGKGKYRSEFEQAETEAKENTRGLWTAGGWNK